ncbi:G1/S-specific cyclin-E1 [Carlito syrichta]|uniref:G1/S-specific cyclin-E1 n=1 Tax=Carlito syrichta TaxID=1868482 RepID=A0A3Q0E842_CARSF|nr:G1/S-specific cyclin-E1 [Carlito syrichta]
MAHGTLPDQVSPSGRQSWGTAGHEAETESRRDLPDFQEAGCTGLGSRRLPVAPAYLLSECPRLGGLCRELRATAFLQDPDEEVAKIDRTARGQCGGQPWDSNSVCANPCSLIPTPDKEEDELAYPNSTHQPPSFAPSRGSPLPVLNWASSEEVWKIMLNKEKTYLRDQHFMQRHPLLQPKMRAILLDWLMEEIYPPKLHQFAYVTDGACSGDEILTMELMIMKALKWRLSPLTIVSWLNVYMQVAYLNDLYEVLLPQYPQQIFIQIAELLDLCVLDVDCLEFSYGVLAASALYHFSSSELMQKVSGYQWCDIESCVKWMVPFALVVREMGSSKLKHFRGVPADDAHNIQTHRNSLDLLDKAQAKKAILSEQNRISPLPTGILTPPQSSKKQSSGQGTV